MRLPLIMSFLAAAAVAQQPSPAPAVSAPETSANLPAQSIGVSDLIRVSVYGAPDFDRTVRVGADGFIRLPMIKQRIKAEGLYPAALETAIAAELQKEEFFVDPFVTVTIAEYHSRPISVSGAVKAPLEFQASSPTPLLEAISRAGGLSDNAGSEILVDLNFTLTGGEQILVPEASKVYVAGYVKMPNAYKVQDGSSVMQILALSQGLAPFAGKVAYIYRPDGSGNRTEIAVPLGKILDRKAPDVPLLANDIFYVPDSKGKRISLTALEKIAPFGAIVGSALIYRP
jgi:polysaccharide export outer membrane protein